MPQPIKPKLPLTPIYLPELRRSCRQWPCSHCQCHCWNYLWRCRFCCRSFICGHEVIEEDQVICHCCFPCCHGRCHRRRISSSLHSGPSHHYTEESQEAWKNCFCCWSWRHWRFRPSIQIKVSLLSSCWHNYYQCWRCASSHPLTEDADADPIVPSNLASLAAKKCL